MSSSRPPSSLRIRGGDIALLYESDRAEYFLFRKLATLKRKMLCGNFRPKANKSYAVGRKFLPLAVARRSETKIRLKVLGLKIASEA